MCLLVLAWRSHPDFRLVLAGNRDEFHDRPAAAADWWADAPGVLAGRDLQAGGTWLGVARDGRWAVVTNYREPLVEEDDPTDAAAASRGALVADYLRGSGTPAEHAREIALGAYRGFNLLLGDRDSLVYVSNRGRGQEALPPGVYGLSNHLLDTPWPKLARTRARFRALLAGKPEPQALLAMLADAAPAADGELPDTGVGTEWERLLSAPFIVSAAYGTRCSTALRLREDGEMEFMERRFDRGGASVGESVFRYSLTGATA
jgi:uncharacterized protein with NRDE domain